MAIKRVLLPFCDGGRVAPVAEAAFVIGRLFSAQVSGVFARPLHVTLPINDDIATPEIFNRVIENARRERAEKLSQAQQMFEACAGRFPHVDSEFAAAEGEIGGVVGHAARLADISVLGSGSHFAAKGWQEVRGAALFGSGRPVLLVPPAGADERSFERVVIAWKESVEAARAIAAAQPFLRHAKQVYLTAIGENAELTVSLQDVEQYLQLHYAEVRSEVVPASAKSTGEVLLGKCDALGGALLVMGAYSHWRWQERVFGGITELVLRAARTPVLMAH